MVMGLWWEYMTVSKSVKPLLLNPNTFVFILKGAKAACYRIWSCQFWGWIVTGWFTCRLFTPEKKTNIFSLLSIFNKHYTNNGRALLCSQHSLRSLHHGLCKIWESPIKNTEHIVMFMTLHTVWSFAKLTYWPFYSLDSHSSAIRVSSSRRHDYKSKFLMPRCG